VKVPGPDAQLAPAASDESLMISLASGDMRALGALYLRFGDSALRFLFHQTSDRATAEDLCQEVFLTLAETASRYRHADKLRSWVLGIAAKKARAHQRKEWRRRRLRGIFGDRDAAATQTAPQLRGPMSAALAALPAAQREVLVLQVVEELSGEQIAEALGIGHGAVRARLFRARAALREHMRRTGQSSSVAPEKVIGGLP